MKIESLVPSIAYGFMDVLITSSIVEKVVVLQFGVRLYWI